MEHIRYIHPYPFQINIRPEIRDDALKLADELVEWLRLEFDVFLRMKPTVNIYTDFGAGEEKATLAFRVALLPKTTDANAKGKLIDTSVAEFENEVFVPTRVTGY